jgi:hypothetical protein
MGDDIKTETQAATPQPPDWKPPEGAQINPPPAPVNLGDVTTQETSPPKPAESPPEEKVEFKGLAVRTGGDQIFLLKEGKKHWVTTPEAYANLGFKFGDEAEIDRLTLGVIPEGEPIK